jgi:hypothetical protein
MGRKTARPLTTAEAKWRLRMAVSDIRPTRAVARHPLVSSIASALLGFAVARNGALSPAVLRLARTLLRHL